MVREKKPASLESKIRCGCLSRVFPSDLQCEMSRAISEKK